MTSPATHGFALYSVELEYRDSDVLTRIRPQPTSLPTDEPVVNPRGVLLEQASDLLEARAAGLLALTSGTNKQGEPVLDYLGYLGPDDLPVFVNVQPVSLYNMAETLIRVSVVHVEVSAGDCQSDADSNEVLFIVSREGVLKPLEKSGVALWPQALLDVIAETRQSNDMDGSFRITTANDVHLDTLYYHKSPGYADVEPTHQCFAVCRTGERAMWLKRAKLRIRDKVDAELAELKRQTDALTTARDSLK